MTRVLVVDDDPTVREVVVAYLRREGLETTDCGDGESALDLAYADPPDLVVLDLMLPGLDGLEVFRRLRGRHGSLPVVMLTARGDERDRVLGLEIGADDYLSKPFSARELVLRVQSVLRRSQPAGPPPRGKPTALLDVDLRLDPAARTVLLGGNPLSLTVREYDLLHHFMTHPGEAFSREDLMRQVWGWEYGDQSTVTVHVRRLREKVEPDPATPSRIATVWGVGYRWDGVAAGRAGTPAPEDSG